MSSEDTIVAMATPPGIGGVGIIRLSGKLASSIAHVLTHQQLKPRYASLCQLKNDQGTVLDESIVLYFKAPHSFTGEDVVEFQCHGSPFVLDWIIQQCIQQGARLAEPGEFSLRAFLNGKIDLMQAESIADLIHASSEQSARMALHSLSGVFSEKIHQLERELIYLRTFIEAGIDFSDEEIDVIQASSIENHCLALKNHLETIQGQAKQGSIMRDGLKIVIAGQPNAGKSTLMNALAGKDVAIVTSVAGTTRDVMKEAILIEGIPLLLVDTAGLHETSCEVEQEGIRRAKEAIKEANLLLWMIDLEAKSDALVLEKTLLDLLPPQTPILKVFNKLDVFENSSIHLDDDSSEHIYLSAKTGQGMDLLRSKILQKVGYQPSESIFIARRRHLEALASAAHSIDAALHHIQTTRALELIAEELRLAQHALNSLTGEFTSDDLLGEIFSTFCIGK